MLRHYVVVALRSFARAPLAGLIGAAALALGLACFIAAHVFVSYLRGYDTRFPHADRAYVVMQSTAIPASGYSTTLLPASTHALAEHIELLRGTCRAR